MRFMYAKIKRKTKPIRKKDFYLPSGEPITEDMGFLWYGTWKFKNIPLSGAMDLVKKGSLIVRRRVELKVELRKTFRVGKKVSSKTWHLASILEHDTADPQKCELFWRKVDEKLHNFDLSEMEEKNIWKTIEVEVPRNKSVGGSG